MQGGVWETEELVFILVDSLGSAAFSWSFGFHVTRLRKGSELRLMPVPRQIYLLPREQGPLLLASVEVAPIFAWIVVHDGARKLES